MANETDIVNIALAHIGADRILSYGDETTKEGRLLVALYPQARDEVLLCTASLTRSASGGTLRFVASDAPERFAEVGRAFLNQEIENVEWVDF